MDRRTFALTPFAVCLAACGVTEDASAQAAYKSGTDYLTVNPSAPVDSLPAGKVEVVEFFGYWCPHCNAFEPTLDAWLAKLPSSIVFKRVPVFFRPGSGHEQLQKLHYTLEAMGQLPKLHRKVFASLHTERAPMQTDADMAAWAKKQGLDAAQFAQAYASFGVNNKVKRANQLVQAYGIEGVPSFGVAGKYYVDGTRAKSMPRALQIVEALALQTAAGK